MDALLGVREEFETTVKEIFSNRYEVKHVTIQRMRAIPDDGNDIDVRHKLHDLNVIIGRLHAGADVRTVFIESSLPCLCQQHDQPDKASVYTQTDDVSVYTQTDDVTVYTQTDDVSGSKCDRYVQCDLTDNRDQGTKTVGESIRARSAKEDGSPRADGESASGAGGSSRKSSRKRAAAEPRVQGVTTRSKRRKASAAAEEAPRPVSPVSIKQEPVSEPDACALESDDASFPFSALEVTKLNDSDFIDYEHEAGAAPHTDLAGHLENNAETFLSPSNCACVEFLQHRCVICSDVTEHGSWATLSRHIVDAHFRADSDDEYAFHCPLADCDKVYLLPHIQMFGKLKRQTLPKVINHMHSQHGVPYPDWIVLWPCMAPGCNYVNVTQSLLRLHQRAAHEGQPAVMTPAVRMSSETLSGVQEMLASGGGGEAHISQASCLTFSQNVCVLCDCAGSGAAGTRFESWLVMRKHVVDAHFRPSATSKLGFRCPQAECDKEFTLPVIGKYGILKRQVLPSIVYHLYSQHAVPFPPYIGLYPCPAPGCRHVNVTRSLLLKHQKKTHREIVHQLPLAADGVSGTDQLDTTAEGTGSSSTAVSSSCLEFLALKCVFCPAARGQYESWLVLRKHIVDAHFSAAPTGRLRYDCPHEECKKEFVLPSIGTYGILKRQLLPSILYHMYSQHREPFPDYIRPQPCPEPGCVHVNVTLSLLRKHVLKAHRGRGDAGDRVEVTDSPLEEEAAESRLPPGNRTTALTFTQLRCVLCRSTKVHPSWLVLRKHIADSHFRSGPAGRLQYRCPRRGCGNVFAMPSVGRYGTLKQHVLPSIVSHMHEQHGAPFPPFLLECACPEPGCDHVTVTPALLSRHQQHAHAPHLSGPLTRRRTRSTVIPVSTKEEAHAHDDTGEDGKGFSFSEYRCMLCYDEPAFRRWSLLKGHLVECHFRPGADGKGRLRCLSCEKVFSLPNMGDSYLRDYLLPKVIFHRYTEHGVPVPSYIRLRVHRCASPDCSYVTISDKLFSLHQYRAHPDHPLAAMETEPTDTSAAYGDDDASMSLETGSDPETDTSRGARASRGGKSGEEADDTSESDGNRTAGVTYHVLRCVLCSDVTEYASWPALRKHLVDAHFSAGPSPVYACPHEGCDKAFVIPGHQGLSRLKRHMLPSILYHMRQKHGVPFPEFVQVVTCPARGCAFRHVTHADLVRHRNRVHRKSVPPGRGRGGVENHTHHQEAPVVKDGAKTNQEIRFREFRCMFCAGDAGKDGAGDAGKDGAGDAGKDGAGDAGKDGAGDAGKDGAGDAGKDFGDWVALKEHMVTTHFPPQSTGKGKTTCPDCDKTFILPNTADSYVRDCLLPTIIYHRYSQHDTPFPAFMELALLRCAEPACTYTTLCQSNLARHAERSHRHRHGRSSPLTPLKVIHAHALAPVKSEPPAESDNSQEASVYTQIKVERDDVTDDMMTSGEQDENACGGGDVGTLTITSVRSLQGAEGAYFQSLANHEAANQQDLYHGEESDTGDQRDLYHGDTGDSDTEYACSPEAGGDVTSVSPLRSRGRGFPRIAALIKTGRRKASNSLGGNVRFHSYRCVFCPGHTHDYRNWKSLETHMLEAHFAASEDARYKYELRCPYDLCQRKFRLPEYGTSGILKGNLLPSLIYHAHRMHRAPFPEFLHLFRCAHPGCAYAHVSRHTVRCHKSRCHTPRAPKRRERVVCDACGADVSASVIAKHKRFHCKAAGERDKMRCPHCDKTFASQSGLWSHVNGVHINTTPRLMCQLCSHRTHRQKNLDEHVYKIHGQNPTNIEVLRCPHCDFSTLLGNVWNRHVNGVHKSQVFTCKVCGENFNKKGTLARHNETHSDVVYQCDQCSYSSKHRNFFQRHVRIQHTRKTRYKCDYCTYSSGYSENTRKHMKVCAPKHGH